MTWPPSPAALPCRRLSPCAHELVSEVSPGQPASRICQVAFERSSSLLLCFAAAPPSNACCYFVAERTAHHRSAERGRRCGGRHGGRWNG